MLLRTECLTELRAFLKKHHATREVVRRLHEAVEGRGSWDNSKAQELHSGIGVAATDIAKFEAEAVGLDGKLSKAQLSLRSENEPPGSEDLDRPPVKTSCRGHTVDLTVALEVVQRGVGWRQSEADTLAALWSSFRERREEVMKSLNKLANEASQGRAQESSVQVFQNR